VSSSERRRPTFLPDADKGESTFLGDLLRQETVGGAIVLVAATIAVPLVAALLAASILGRRSRQLKPSN
jgi:NhaA family Na+:H+ antiporter